MGADRPLCEYAMQRLTSIVAVNQQGVIGCGNALPWRLKTDMRFFRKQTIGNVVLMGRKTFDSLDRKPLVDRYNVVISHFGLFAETRTCRFAAGIADGLFRASLAPRLYKEAFVIGGASMYEQYAPFVDRYLITLVDKYVLGGDTYFYQELVGDPDLWTLNPIASVEADSENEAPFTIFELVARQPEGVKARRDEAIEQVRRNSVHRKAEAGEDGRRARSSAERHEARPML